jgi:hypothetical protein
MHCSPERRSIELVVSEYYSQFMSCATWKKNMSTRAEHSDSAAAAAPTTNAAASSAVVSDEGQTRQGNFFGMFFLPSSQLNDDDDDVHLLSASTSTYSPMKAAASAASNMIGGILSVIDTALAAMNEEMENSSSNNSIETKEDQRVSELRTIGSCTNGNIVSRGIHERCGDGELCRNVSNKVGDVKQSSTINEEICTDNSEQTCNSGT